jgi:hypothetical protein
MVRRRKLLVPQYLFADAHEWLQAVPHVDLSSVEIREANMANNNRYWYRLAMLLLVVIPFTPEIFIFAVAAFASLRGYQSDTCFVGSSALGRLIDTALRLGAGLIVERVSNSYKWFWIFYTAFAGWLVVCYLLLLKGWSRLSSRLALGFAVAVTFAVLPFFGPIWALVSISTKNSCDPNIGPCILFGEKITQAYAAVVLAEPILQYPGAKLAITIFAFFAIWVALERIVAAKWRSS